jgi:hypothetical protein
VKPDGGERIPDGSSAGIPDGALAGIPDGAGAGIPDRARTGPDGAADGIPDVMGAVDAATVCAVPPAPACVPGPGQEVTLTTLGYWDITGLAPAGEELFFASRDNDNPTPAGQVTRLALRSRQTQSFDLSGVPLYFHHQAGAVIYGPAFTHPTEAYSWLVPDVVRWDLQTGDRNELPRLSGFQNPDVESLAVNARGEIFWCVKEGSRSAIAKWSPCTQQTELLAEGHNTLFLYADETTVYWQEVERAGGGTRPLQAFLYSMPSAGGAATLLVTLPTDSWNGTILHGIDEQRLYYLDPDVGLMAMPKQGGEAQLVIAKPRFMRWTVDDTHIYWVDSSQQSTLRRTPKQGGPTESLWTNPSDGHIQAVAVDACNVYWFAVNPQTLRYRAK